MMVTMDTHVPALAKYSDVYCIGMHTYPQQRHLHAIGSSQVTNPSSKRS